MARAPRSRDSFDSSDSSTSPAPVAPTIGATRVTRLPRTTRELGAYLQRRATSAAATASAPADAIAIATAGTAGPAQALPHLDRIQAAFGNHDVRGVGAHIGGEAAAASEALGAHGYAIGDQIAFASGPDLHLAAHEAAHVVQQRAGVQLASVDRGRADPFEQHADRVADAVVRGADAQPILDELATGGASARAIQRKEDPTLYDVWMHALPPEQRFAHVDEREQRKLLVEAPARQRAALLETVSPGHARALLFEAELTPQDRFTAVLDLPDVARILSVEQAWSLFEHVHTPLGGQRRLFAKFPVGLRMQLLPLLSTRLQSDVYPAYNGASPAEHAAMLSTLSDFEIGGIFQGRGDDEVQVILETVPRHIAIRIERTLGTTHGGAMVPAESEEAHAAIEAEAEAGAGVPRPARRTHGVTPSSEEYEALPRDERVEIFLSAAVATRVRLLQHEPDGKRKMLREIRGREMVETLAAYVNRTGNGSLVHDFSAEELAESVLADPDPVAIAALLPHMTYKQRTLVMPALSPSHLAAFLADAKHDRDAAWQTVHGACDDTTTGDALRRMSDDQLTDLHFQLSPDLAAQMLALVPQSRRALFPAESP